MARGIGGFYATGMDATVAPVAEPKRKATYDDVLAAPEHQVAEILGGELFLSPRPAFPHARATSLLGSELTGAFDRESAGPAGPGGWWLVDEPELHFGGDVVVPDIAGWRRERMPSLPGTAWCELAPDWVCETLSPSTTRIDRTRKLAIYARESVRHVWLLDPLARTLEALVLESGRWVIDATHAGDEIVRAVPFATVEIALGRLWID